mgnify:CR=1 FL=1
MKIAFDIDDTLIIPLVALYKKYMYDVPNYNVIAIYRWFQENGASMIVWSGGGIDYARMWADKLGLFPDEIRVKEKSDDIDMVFDDCDVDLGKVNIKVKRLNNQVSRKYWNEHKDVFPRNKPIEKQFKLPDTELNKEGGK